MSRSSAFFKFVGYIFSCNSRIGKCPSLKDTPIVSQISTARFCGMFCGRGWLSGWVDGRTHSFAEEGLTFHV